MFKFTLYNFVRFSFSRVHPVKAQGMQGARLKDEYRSSANPEVLNGESPNLYSRASK
jgi:hypothetical protein